jgi:DNA-binding NarL/FixJ family response regulator
MLADALELLLEGTPDLESAGSAPTAEEGLEVCRARCPDVVLMDIDLPGMDGIAATRELHGFCHDTHVVIITALRRPDLIAEAVEAGAGGFVPKTQAADDLLGVIRRAAQGEMILPSGDTRELLEELMRARSLRAEARELVLQLSDRKFVEGRNTHEVADALFISPYTVQSHTRNLLAKLGVRSRLEAVVRGLRLGIVTLPRD